MAKNMANPQNNIFRYERKFFIQNYSRKCIETIILQHPYFFSEIYHERYINSIYFDYLNFNNFMDNIDGNMDRKKYRIRWYGTLFTEIINPVLEVKIKKGLVGTKENHSLQKFNISKGVNTSELKTAVNRSNIDPQVKMAINDQFPVILNRYKRKYFESKNRKFRVTIDCEQEFYKFNILKNTFLQCHKDPTNIILEIKYEKQYDSEAEHITNHLPFRITKSSKYARGVALLYC